MPAKYISLTELGKTYGVSSHQVGKWLRGLGLRTDGNRPSQLAFDEGFVERCPSKQPGTHYWVWHEQKTTEILDNMQYPKATSEQTEL